MPLAVIAGVPVRALICSGEDSRSRDWEARKALDGWDVEGRGRRSVARVLGSGVYSWVHWDAIPSNGVWEEDKEEWVPFFTCRTWRQAGWGYPSGGLEMRGRRWTEQGNGIVSEAVSSEKRRQLSASIRKKWPGMGEEPERCPKLPGSRPE